MLFFRDEENKIVDEVFLKLKKPKQENVEQFKAHDIPIESQIPLFDKIMADQERRWIFMKTYYNSNSGEILGVLSQKKEEKQLYKPKWNHFRSPNGMKTYKNWPESFPSHLQKFIRILLWKLKSSKPNLYQKTCLVTTYTKKCTKMNTIGNNHF